LVGEVPTVLDREAIDAYPRIHATKLNVNAGELRDRIHEVAAQE
jgi:hypothetical protein